MRKFRAFGFTKAPIKGDMYHICYFLFMVHGRLSTCKYSLNE
ncbi:Hypothetical protein EAG7_01923 [Klebsiella aerogenes]|nr:Hypothetical protein EAG7_01923 [Klebsiella aerogenes]PVF74518.1 hypothetical protein CSC18_2969 [Klebsiella aerogenes]CCG30398.1 hypothetical protein [Klebsiella aerogenes EA1509E]